MPRVSRCEAPAKRAAVVVLKTEGGVIRCAVRQTSLRPARSGDAGKQVQGIRYHSAVDSIAIIVVGVLTFSALLGWMMLRGMTSAERAERDPKYGRRFRLRLLLFQSGICVAGAVLCVVQLLTRQPPQQIISTLLMVLINLSTVLVAARNLKNSS